MTIKIYDVYGSDVDWAHAKTEFINSVKSVMWANNIDITSPVIQEKYTNDRWGTFNKNKQYEFVCTFFFESSGTYQKFRKDVVVVCDGDDYPLFKQTKRIGMTLEIVT
jgi:hypothetical protein